MGLSEVEDILQKARLELYRDNLSGALQILERSRNGRTAARLDAESRRIRSWLGHLASPEAYAQAYETYYRARKARLSLKLLERELRTWSGRRTRKMVQRYADYPEFRMLEREVLAVGATRVFDAGCGEGRVALTLGARHPNLRVEGLEITQTNVRIARRLNRFSNVAFTRGFIEDAEQVFLPQSFDLAYSFAVLEHVPDVDRTVGAILAMLRPGGRFCLVVPMNEFIVTMTAPRVRAA
jgi:2-polyprenyl-3-methyl-5-hydroxy-6-metoxy-1,4-benzoquinol methylase